MQTRREGKARVCAHRGSEEQRGFRGVKETREQSSCWKIKPKLHCGRCLAFLNIPSNGTGIEGVIKRPYARVFSAQCCDLGSSQCAQEVGGMGIAMDSDREVEYP